MWIKTESGYKSKCGRFNIVRHIRRGGIEWTLTDNVVPVELGVSGPKSKLSDAKDAAMWRLANRKPQGETV